MTAKQFEGCMALARDDRDLSHVDDSALHGLAKPDFPAAAYVSAEVVARFVRWHCLMLNGKWDQGEVEEMRQLCRRRVQLVPESAARMDEMLAAVRMLKLVS